MGALVTRLYPRPDAVFNALHGRFGEDGCVQGLLNILDIPYTHSGLLASALAMDKPMAKRIFAEAGLDVAEHRMYARRGSVRRPLAQALCGQALEQGSASASISRAMATTSRLSAPIIGALAARSWWKPSFPAVNSPSP